MENSPVFTIVIPAYNYGHFLADTLESVRAQNRSDIQVLLIDDASTDNTAEIARGQPDLLHYVRNERNLGAGGAWKRGIELATGKYLVKLDADDQLLPGHLDAVEKAFEANPRAAMVVSSVLLKNETSGETHEEIICGEDTALEAEEFRQRFMSDFFFRMPGCALRMAYLVGHERPDERLFQIHDWEYFLRVTKGHGAVMLSSPTAVYRKHDCSVSATARKEESLRKDVKRWIDLAGRPGVHRMDRHELDTLRGSLAILLITGFGKPSGLQWFSAIARNYLRALTIAAGGGVSQLARLHSALARKIGRVINAS